MVVVASFGLMGVATLLGGVSSGEADVAKVLPGIAEELEGVSAGGGVAVVVVAADAVRVVAATLTVGTAVTAGEAEGTKGLASTLSVDAVTCADGPVDKEGADGRSGRFLDGLNKEAEASVGLGFVTPTLAREGVLVMGVAVCESGVEPGGV